MIAFNPSFSLLSMVTIIFGFGGNSVEFHTSPIKELLGAWQKLLNIRRINFICEKSNRA